ncbi:GNAT superfamily N-acetyltransferase [Bacillus pakistanensis]|uniref:GNAT superfamily N-acetyltransferase n=1 Tax=Rossellomorea pakistanensis TaxID=992288 RepID=A0ABS2N8E7_9BACI|nr:GNAT family N-acetyltransferase [Bacillus pakistanensis]MBM7584127.1 GNAT superfamily N-acetyltransferase [Bacillus pakistanensis]
MQVKDIVKAISSHHWDYKKEDIPHYIENIMEDNLIAIKNHKVLNPFNNKVVHLYANSKDEIRVIWGKIHGLYNEHPFSLWISESLGDEVKTFIRERGFSVVEQYEGLALKLEDWKGDFKGDFSIREVKNDNEINQLVEVASEIWSYPKEEKSIQFQQRKRYIENKLGGYMIAYHGEKPVGYGNYRYSLNGDILYLCGSGIIPSYRKKGIYRQLVTTRLTQAQEEGVKLATCQARVGHSLPILKKIGFGQYTTFDYWIKNND